MSNPRSEYIGRFAPTPSGPLHFGSVIAALASYLEAHSNQGKWLLRIDDLDTPRVRAGANSRILQVLEELGLYWDNEIVYQSNRQSAYEEAAHQLQLDSLLYFCACSRKKIQGKPYLGTCRDLKLEPAPQHSMRIKTETNLFSVDDQIQNAYRQNILEDVGDFIVRRADGIFAYHLAVVVDDAAENVSHIVRGTDLMDSTPRQIFLQEKLGVTTPAYAHLPVAINSSGDKICKQHKAEDVLLSNSPVKVLFDSLEFLGQNPDEALLDATVADLIKWGIENWQLSNVPKSQQSLAAQRYQSRPRTSDS